MGTRTERWTDEELAAHTVWARRLAGSLLTDPGAADDVVQKAWVAVLRRPPSEPLPPRAWWATVVRNFANQWRRGEASRGARERSAARDDRLPSTRELLERVETQDVLSRALQGLAEPYRTTLLLRYVEDLSAAEIARREGASAGTVRSRLARGLTLLRESLDARFAGDRTAWVASLAALGPRPPGALPWLSGGVLMNATWKLSAAGAVIASLGIWWSRGEGSEPAAAEVAVSSVEVAPPTAPPPASPAAADGASAEPTGGRDAVLAVALPPAPEPEREAAAPAPLVGAAEARIVDEAGRSIAEAELAPAAGRGESTSERSGDRARVSLPLQRDGTGLLLAASAPGRATRFVHAVLRPGEVTYLGEVALVPGGTVVGRVVDVAGRPVAAAEVLALEVGSLHDLERARRRGPEAGEGAFRAKTDGAGAFVLEALGGPMRIWTSAPGMRWAFSAPVDASGGGLYDVGELALEPLEDADRIAGVVLGPDGAPLPDAAVFGYWRSTGSGGAQLTRVDANGRFDHRVAARVPHDVVAVDPVYGRLEAPRVEPGTLDLELRFEELVALAFIVRASRGAPVPDFDLWATSADTGHSIADAQVRGSEDGSGALPVQSGASVRVRVSAEGYARAELGPLLPRSVDAPIEVVLAPLPGVRGRVVHRGEPVAGAKVSVRRDVSTQVVASHRGARIRYEPWADSEAETDADGAFVLTVGSEEDVWVVADAEGLGRAEVGPLAIDPERGAGGIELALELPGAIEGRVLAPPGDDPAGWVVAASRGDETTRTVRVDAAGTYRFDGLAAGAWLVERAEVEVDPGDTGTSYMYGEGVPLPDYDVRVEPGRVTRHDLDLAERRKYVLAGSLAIGGPCEGWSAALRPPRGSLLETERTALDADGAFRFEVDEPGAWTLWVETPVDGGVQRVVQVVELSEPRTEWIADLPAGTLAGTGAPSAEESEQGLRLTWSDGSVLFEARFHGDAAGRFELGRVPAGRLTLQRVADPASPTLELVDLREVNVLPGGRLDVRIR